MVFARLQKEVFMKILLVEDSVSMGKAIKTLLEAQGHAVIAPALPGMGGTDDEMAT